MKSCSQNVGALAFECHVCLLWPIREVVTVLALSSLTLILISVALLNHTCYSVQV